MENIAQNCKHGIDERFCGFCSGVVVKSRKVSVEADVRSEVFGVDWTEEEYLILYAIFEKVAVKGFRRAVSECAKALQRTRKSIVWHYKHMFVIPNDPRAGKVLLKFKQDIGLAA